MTETLFIPTSQKEIFEAECKKSLIGFSSIQVLDNPDSMRYAIEFDYYAQLFYLGCAYAYSTVKPVPFTEEQLTQQ